MRPLKFVTARVLALLAVVVMLAPSHPVLAEGSKELIKKGDFVDVRDDLRNAIINRGFVVDFVGQLNSMLQRTGEAVGASSPYKNAEFMQFCAAKLTHDAVAANPANIANCPYTMFVYELAAKPGEVHVGYRRPSSGGGEGSDKAVGAIEALLAEIIGEAAR